MSPKPSILTATAATLVLFGAYTIDSVLADPHWAQKARTYDLVELWSGVGSLVRAAQQRSLVASGFDITHGPEEDITTEPGFRKALALVMALKPGGLLAMGPDCSSWVFPSSPHHKRHLGIEGNQKFDWVRAGNLMARMAVFFFMLAQRRQVLAFIENPVGSQLFTYINPFLGSTPKVFALVERCAYLSAQEQLTENWKKTWKLLATGVWITAAVRRCSCGSRPHMKLMDVGPEGDKTGRKEDMKKSGAYPAAFGEAVVRAWLQRPVPECASPVPGQMSQGQVPASLRKAKDSFEIAEPSNPPKQPAASRKRRHEAEDDFMWLPWPGEKSNFSQSSASSSRALQGPRPVATALKNANSKNEFEAW